MLLTRQQLEQFSGYKARRCQIDWLRQNGIRYLLGGDGWPRVLLSHVETLLGASHAELPRTRPNIKALDKLQGLR